MENNVNNSSNLNENKTEIAEDANAPQKKSLIKKLFSREVITYLVFGVLTTLVGWAVYFAVMIIGKAIFSIPSDDTTSGAYIALYTAAQISQWVCAVLFAFFTNRKWVFTDADKTKNIFLQLLTFAGGRVLSFGLDYVITFFGGLGLTNLLPVLNSVTIFGIDLNLNEVIAKIVAAVVVIVCNYIFSKLFVFNKTKK